VKKAHYATLLKQAVPEPIKQIIRPVIWLLQGRPDKHASEMAFWEKRWRIEGNRFENARYQKIMLGMAGEEDDSFLKAASSQRCNTP